MKKLLAVVLLLCAPVFPQAWSGVLSSSRAIDWTKAGLPATITYGSGGSACTGGTGGSANCVETPANAWTPPTRAQCGVYHLGRDFWLTGERGRNQHRRRVLQAGKLRPTRLGVLADERYQSQPVDQRRDSSWQWGLLHNHAGFEWRSDQHGNRRERGLWCGEFGQWIVLSLSQVRRTRRERANSSFYRSAVRE